MRSVAKWRLPRRAAVALVGASLLAGCAGLPSNGPTAHQIVKETRSTENVLGYDIVDVDPASIAGLGEDSIPTTSNLAGLTASGPVDTIGPGDVLSVEIYEVGAALFSGITTLGSPADAGAFTSSARGQGIGGDGLLVDRDGNVSVPYAGQVHVAGLTPAQAQDALRASLKGMSQNPQILVSVRTNVTNTVMVMGAVQRPGRVPLSLAREHLLDAIAEAGGVQLGYSTGSSTGTGTGSQDMLLRFTRGARTVEQPLDTIQSGAPDDLILLPGDRIEVVRQPRTFIVFGATSRIAQVPFESRVLSLAEALARVGGPSDSQADPTAVFVFRFSHAAAPPPQGSVAVSPPGEERSSAPNRLGTPIIYRLNMLKAQSYFLAQEFAMQDKDVIYIANARTNQPTKLVQILNTLFSPAYAVRALAP